jgi:hypothetical protein
VLHGEATDENVLAQENIDEMDMFLALTNDDEDNIMAASLAKRLGCKRVLALINRRAYADMVQGGPIDIGLRRRRPRSVRCLTFCRRGDVARVHSLRRGAAEALELVVHGDRSSSKVVGRRIEELPVIKGAHIGAIVRDTGELKVVQMEGFLVDPKSVPRGDHPAPRHGDRGERPRRGVLHAQARGAAGREAVPGRLPVPLSGGMKPYYPVIRVFGVLLVCFSLTMLVPWIYSYTIEDGAQGAYDEALLLTLLTGAGLWWAARHQKHELKVRDGFLMVVMVWALLPVFACLPLSFHSTPPSPTPISRPCRG